MTRITVCVWAAVLSIVAGAVGCKRIPQVKCSSGLRKVFGDFQFAGSIRDLNNLESLSVGLPTPGPEHFSPGTKYVFYHRRLSSVYQFESETIPARLRAQQIRFKPLERSDFGYPNEGGPLFTVELDGSCKGRIYNVVDRRIAQDQNLSQVWASEAYIVELADGDCALGDIAAINGAWV